MAGELTFAEEHELNRSTPLAKDLALGTLMHNQLGKLKVVTGRTTFSGTSATKTVPAVTLKGDTLTSVIFASANLETDPAAATTLMAKKTISSGQVTIKRVGSTTSNAEFSYLLIGT